VKQAFDGKIAAATASGSSFGKGEQMSTMQSNTTQISDASFENDVLKASQPVLVDFWAEWCGPCKLIAPSLEEIAQELGAKIKVAKINIDHNPATPRKYGIRGIPTLMLFKNGQVAGTKVGAESKRQLLDWVNSVI
jgi:thioredoxin 1